MRFAMIATCAAALVGAPLVASAASMRMESGAFLNAVRCAAYETAAGDNAETALLRMHLNAEARRQAPATAQQARAEVSAIAREAATADPASLRSQREAACALGGMLAGRASERV